MTQHVICRVSTAALWLVCSAALAQDAPAKLPQDFSQLVGQFVDVETAKGVYLADVEIMKVTAGTEEAALKVLSHRTRGEKKVGTLAANSIREIYVAGQPLDLVQDKKNRQVKVSLEQRQEREAREKGINERLKAANHRLWPHVSADEHEAAMKEAREHLEELKQSFRGLPIQVQETKYFLFATDLPPQQVNGYLKQLDAMYTELCKGFGVPEGKNIWRGKCLVTVFVSPDAFRVYEERFYGELPRAGVQGLCHSHGSGKVVISSYSGDNPTYFGVVLVHETAHGFIHRVRSSVHIPPWINEGIADWVAGTVVKQDNEVTRRQQNAITELRSQPQLSRALFTENAQLQSWHYGMGTQLVTFMLKQGGPKYRDFFLSIKEGLTPEESLKEHYNLTLAELLAAYGRSIGSPQLRLLN